MCSWYSEAGPSRSSIVTAAWLVRKGEESQVTTQLTVAQDVEAPVDQGQTLGQMEVYVGGELRDTIPIVSAQQVDRLTVLASLASCYGSCSWRAEPGRAYLPDPT